MTIDGSLTGPALAKALITALGDIEALQIETIGAAHWDVVEGAWRDVSASRIRRVTEKGSHDRR